MENQENFNSSSIGYQNEEEAALQQQIQVYRKQHHEQEYSENDVEAGGEEQQEEAAPTTSEPVQNLSCTFGSVVVFIFLGAIWGSACKLICIYIF